MITNDGSTCRAINGYHVRCQRNTYGIVCDSQMGGFCGLHMNLSFTCAEILRDVAKMVKDAGRPDLANDIMTRYKVNQRSRKVKEHEPENQNHNR